MLALDSGDATRRCSRSLSLMETKELCKVKLQMQLKSVEHELERKGNHQENLERLRDQLESQIDECTASLFEEANKMVIDANVSRMEKEKELEETQLKIKALKAEVDALKALVMSSSTETSSSGNESPTLQHARNAPTLKKKLSLKNIRFRRHSSQPGAPPVYTPDDDVKTVIKAQASLDKPEILEDLIGFEEFKEWKLCPSFDTKDKFIKRLLEDDVKPALAFVHSQQLTEDLINDILWNKLMIEKCVQPQESGRCFLSNVVCLCSYTVQFSKASAHKGPTFISSVTREKLIVLCDLFSYLSYVKLGLIKGSHDNDVYEQVQLLRKKIVLQRLGFKN